MFLLLHCYYTTVRNVKNNRDMLDPFIWPHPLPVLVSRNLFHTALLCRAHVEESSFRLPRVLRHFCFMNDLGALIVSHRAQKRSPLPRPRKGNFGAEIGEGNTKSGSGPEGGRKEGGFDVACHVQGKDTLRILSARRPNGLMDRRGGRDLSTFVALPQ